MLVLQIRILEESGQLPLAFIAAASHGFEEEATRLREVRADKGSGAAPDCMLQFMSRASGMLTASHRMR